jgi:hypothetical protein
MTTSKVEIVALDHDGHSFIGIGEVTWMATDPKDSELEFKPQSVGRWLVLRNDGTVIGWSPYDND